MSQSSPNREQLVTKSGGDYPYRIHDGVRVNHDTSSAPLDARMANRARRATVKPKGQHAYRRGSVR